MVTLVAGALAAGVWYRTALPAAMPAGGDLCAPLPAHGEAGRPELARKQRREAFMSLLRAHLGMTGAADPLATFSGLGRCITVRAVPGGRQVAVVSLEYGDYRPAGALVYRFGDTWHAWPLNPPDGHLDLKVIPERVLSGDQLLATTEPLGSGGNAKLLLYRLGADVQLLWESPLYEQFSWRRLSDDYLLAFYRTRATYGEPHMSPQNCCLPVDGETLWHREGNRFIEVAERTYPNPYRTVSLFVGALRRGDRATAGQWATSPAVVEAGARVVQELRADQNYPPPTGIDEAEQLYWEAIPVALRGPKPAVTSLDWKAGPYDLILQRGADQWKVSAVEPSHR